MRREFYEAQLEPHKKKAFKSTVDALYDAAYWLGRWAAEKYEEDDPIRSELISLTAQYSMKLEEDISKGKIAQKRLEEAAKKEALK